MTKTILQLALMGAASAWLPHHQRGVIDMDIDIHEKSHSHSGLANHLMNLSQIDGDKEYIEQNLDNFFNIQIYSNIYVGSNRQKFPLIFDSGSSWVWVGHEMCDSCANRNLFSSNQSASFKQMTPKLSQLNYGKGTVVGWDTKDQVCLNEQSTFGHGCMSDYLFKSVVYQEDLGGLASSGLIGLAPSSQYSGSQLFVPSLYKQGAIKQNLFSMFIDSQGQSKIQIGGYDLSKYAQGPMKFYKITNPMFW